MLQASTFQFLTELKANNNRDWFLANKKHYESAKKDVEGFVQEIIKEFSKTLPALSDIKAKDTLFRINRDVRFSNDKSPYKINFGAVISEQGRKGAIPAFYLQIQPGNCFIAAGKWMPSSDELKAIRQEIDYNGAALKSLFASKSTSMHFSNFDQEERLQRAPKGYEEDNQYIEWLKLKSFTLSTEIKDKEFQSSGAVQKVTDVFLAALPIVQFLRTAVNS
jgi:uncharacterized protein (TIGR02453 family)